jgi:[1-hydroxy-2-(trimethylamino)ethyl]phosphonate dioxygenase
VTAAAAARDVVGEIEALFAARGHETYGEGVTIADHCLQTAALARAAGADDALVVAALLHDIGYFLEPHARGTGDHRHDRSGGGWLAARFPAAVSEPVRLHVAAKRYLCAVERDYFGLLSAASKHTLARQGGPMSAAEAAEFARHSFLDRAVRLRRWDDRGKVAGAKVAPLGSYQEAILSVVGAAARLKGGRA